ncbi:MAG: AAA family ATPase [Sandaracinus sp.]
MFDVSKVRIRSAMELDEFRDDGPKFLTHAPLKVAFGARNIAHGPSNVFKTFFVLHSAVQVAQTGAQVLAIVGEGDEARIADRLRGLSCMQGTTLRALGTGLIAVFAAPPLDDDAGATFLLGLVAKVKPRLTIIDPFASIFLGDENRSDTVARVLNVLDAVIASDSAVLLVHHDRKLGKDVGRDMRGHSRMRAWADVITGFEERDGQIVLYDEKQRDVAKSEPRAFVVRFGDDKLVSAIEPVERKPSRREREAAEATDQLLGRVREVLAGGPTTKHKLLVALSVSASTAERLLQKLVDLGEAEKRPVVMTDSRGRETKRDAYVAVVR